MYTTYKFRRGVEKGLVRVKPNSSLCRSVLHALELEALELVVTLRVEGLGFRHDKMTRTGEGSEEGGVERLCFPQPRKRFCVLYLRMFNTNTPSARTPSPLTIEAMTQGSNNDGHNSHHDHRHGASVGNTTQGASCIASRAPKLVSWFSRESFRVVP